VETEYPNWLFYDAGTGAGRRVHRAVFDLLVVLQQGRCAVCLNPNRRLLVDHDHSTGAVRGLLCTRCNNLVGKFERRVLPAAYQRRNPAEGIAVEMYLYGQPPAWATAATGRYLGNPRTP